jgi:hypothetical protein
MGQLYGQHCWCCCCSSHNVGHRIGDVNDDIARGRGHDVAVGRGDDVAMGRGAGGHDVAVGRGGGAGRVGVGPVGGGAVGLKVKVVSVKVWKEKKSFWTYHL